MHWKWICAADKHVSANKTHLRWHPFDSFYYILGLCQILDQNSRHFQNHSAMACWSHLYLRKIWTCTRYRNSICESAKLDCIEVHFKMLYPRYLIWSSCKVSMYSTAQRKLYLANRARFVFKRKMFERGGSRFALLIQNRVTRFEFRVIAIRDKNRYRVPA